MILRSVDLFRKIANLPSKKIDKLRSDILTAGKKYDWGERLDVDEDDCPRPLLGFTARLRSLMRSGSPIRLSETKTQPLSPVRADKSVCPHSSTRPGLTPNKSLHREVRRATLISAARRV